MEFSKSKRGAAAPDADSLFFAAEHQPTSPKEFD
jgi:hypothetical protein